MLRHDIDRDHVPSAPGVYKFLSKGGKILYIGKAKNIRKRLQQYFSPGSVRKQDMVKKAWRVEWLPTLNEQEALMLEIQLINTYLPFYNNLIKGNSSYVYIKIQHGPYPLISLTRYRKHDKHTYIGPKLRKRELKTLLQTLRQIFQRRSCSNSTFEKGIVCSDYFFGLCKGWCAYHALENTDIQSTNQNIGFKPKMNQKDAQEAYKDIITVLGHFFQGSHKPLQELLQRQIEDAVEKEHYERAAKLRDMYHIVAHITEKQTVILDRPHAGIYVTTVLEKATWYRVVITLQEGRIIDVITGHEQENDIDQQLLLNAINREFDTTLHPSTYIENSYFALSAKRLSKKHQTILYKHAQSFIQGYQNSRLKQDSRAYDLLLLEQIQERYHVHTLPIHIECVDISHFSGDWTAGAISGMYYGKIQKTMYRKYKIRSAQKHDDYGALKEVLQRRFLGKGVSSPPELFVLDGGKGQLGVLSVLLKEDKARENIFKMTTFVSLGKGAARTRKGKQTGVEECIYMFRGNGMSEVALSYDEADRLLVKLRDEAHRFANRYRKQLQSTDYKESKK